LQQLTVDQTLYQHAVALGAVANAPPKNVLLQALGPHAEVEAEIRLLYVEPGDVYLVCSDGLHGMVDDAQIARILAATAAADLAPACRSLLECANANGGRDNVTAVLARFEA